MVLITASRILRKFLFLSEDEQSKLIDVKDSEEFKSRLHDYIDFLNNLDKVFPAKKNRELNQKELKFLVYSAKGYVELKNTYMD